MAHLKVTNDVLMKQDAGNILALILLEYSAVFDTINHAIRISRLKQLVG